MYKLCAVVVLCCALFPRSFAAPKSSAANITSQAEGSAERSDRLREELDGQQSLLSKLLGDYDKVKALSEGSDCRCKCVVRPLSRSACRRIEDGRATAQDFYTVETITSGPECKCACIAPPSAVNPCEGEFRLKKLTEAGKENVKLSTILELLEGSFYGMDLLKLHSLTSKLLGRVDHIEKVVSLAEEVKPQEATERAPTASPRRRPEAGGAAAGEAPEGEFGKNPAVPTDGSHQIIDVRNVASDEALQSSRTGLSGMIIRGMTFYKSEPDPMVADDGEPGENFFEYHGFSGDGPISLFVEENLLQHRVPRPRPGSGSSLYGLKTSASKKSSQLAKPKEAESESQNEVVSASETTEPVDLSTLVQSDTRRVTTGPTTSPKARTNSAGQRLDRWPVHMRDEPSASNSTANSTRSSVKSTTGKPLNSTKATPALEPTDQMQTTAQGTAGPSARPTTESTTAAAAIATFSAPTSARIHPEASTTSTSEHAATATPGGDVDSQRPTAQPAPLTTSPTGTAATRQVPQAKRKYKISWDEADVDDGRLELDEPMHRQEKTFSKKPEECKDTLATISEPVTRNSYGRKEGAWMKDPKSDQDKIYVTNFYYGNNLLEFRNLEVFKQGRFTNSYKLPYNWIGTGHVVYDGAFYYNRAFSRDIIKFDLHHRYVAAWTLLHDALFDESSSPWEWRSRSDIDFAVDESGLWIIYPALDDEGFLQEVIVLSRLNPSDLSMQRETTWRTGLRRNRYGNCFIVCGVLYAVDSYNQKHANLEYAFDTHTNTQMVPRMPFTNNYTYTTQIDYNPKEGVLYAWDNGHQVTYNIKFAYVDP